MPMRVEVPGRAGADRDGLLKWGRSGVLLSLVRLPLVLLRLLLRRVVRIVFGPVTGTTLLAPFSTDRGHVVAILADGHPAFTPGLTGFVTGELVGRALLVSGAASFACDLPLLRAVH